jgi:hypothetical protein
MSERRERRFTMDLRSGRILDGTPDAAVEEIPEEGESELRSPLRDEELLALFAVDDKKRPQPVLRRAPRHPKEDQRLSTPLTTRRGCSIRGGPVTGSGPDRLAR